MVARYSRTEIRIAYRRVTVFENKGGGPGPSELFDETTSFNFGKRFPECYLQIVKLFV